MEGTWTFVGQLNESLLEKLSAPLKLTVTSGKHSTSVQLMFSPFLFAVPVVGSVETRLTVSSGKQSVALQVSESVVRNRIQVQWFDLASGEGPLSGSSSAEGQGQPLELVFCVTDLPAVRPSGLNAYAYHYKNLKKDLETGDLVTYGVSGSLASVAGAVLRRSTTAHAGVVLKLPNRWTGIATLYVVELTANCDAFMDAFRDAAVAGVNIFRFEERLHQYHGAPEIRVLRPTTPLKAAKKKALVETAFQLHGSSADWVAAVLSRNRGRLSPVLGLLSQSGDSASAESRVLDALSVELVRELLGPCHESIASLPEQASLDALVDAFEADAQLLRSEAEDSEAPPSRASLTSSKKTSLDGRKSNSRVTAPNASLNSPTPPTLPAMELGGGMSSSSPTPLQTVGDPEKSPRMMETSSESSSSPGDGGGSSGSGSARRLRGLGHNTAMSQSMDSRSLLEHRRSGTLAASGTPPPPLPPPTPSSAFTSMPALPPRDGGGADGPSLPPRGPDLPPRDDSAFLSVRPNGLGHVRRKSLEAEAVGDEGGGRARTQTAVASRTPISGAQSVARLPNRVPLPARDPPPPIQRSSPKPNAATVLNPSESPVGRLDRRQTVTGGLQRQSLSQSGGKSLADRRSQLTSLKAVWGASKKTLRDMGTEFDESAPESSIEMILTRMRQAEGGLPICDIPMRGKTHRKVFLGCDMVDWLLKKGFSKSREEAVELCGEFVAAGKMYPITRRGGFVDGMELFKFMADDENYLYVPGIFDTSLQDVVAMQHSVSPQTAVPTFLECALHSVRAHGGFAMIGIFRLAAATAEVDALKLLVQDGHYGAVLAETDAHVPACLLKQWLRSLSDPVVPAARYLELVQKVAPADSPDARAAYVASLPLENQATLYALMLFLAELARPEHTEATKMDAKNLATVFTPCLLRSPSSNPLEAIMFLPAETSFVVGLIEDFSNHVGFALSGASSVGSRLDISKLKGA